MTGTGTRADPYRPETWDEIVTAIGTTGTFVVFAEDLDIDLSDTTISNVKIRAYSIDCNNCILRNITTNSHLFVFDSNGYTTIFKLHIIDFMSTKSESALFYVSGGAYYKYFYDCSFVGEADFGFWFDNDHGNFLFDINRCYLDISTRRKDDGFFLARWYNSIHAYIRNSYVYVNTKRLNDHYPDNVSRAGMMLELSLLLGIIDYVYISQSSIYSVINCKTRKIDGTVTNQCLLINAKPQDDIESPTISITSYTPITEEELHNTATLRSKGLPIHIKEGDR